VWLGSECCLVLGVLLLVVDCCCWVVCWGFCVFIELACVFFVWVISLVVWFVHVFCLWLLDRWVECCLVVLVGGGAFECVVEDRLIAGLGCLMVFVIVLLVLFVGLCDLLGGDFC